ncbi:MAG: HlyD family secretion protein [Candidatus Thiothrix putei]|uniref:HlyD family secretion protein n=1 Tax=Candidatus Thiothrix putei TaxID=3080811 RepID=A0AA95KKS5_9GAMM|nr:MAG: HlyD family secretion protein [Candidatus Thiothrix putei]
MKALKISLLLIAVLALVGGAWFWSDYSSQHPSTDDAYVAANTVNISPQTAGQVAEVLVKSFQPVKKGDVLLRLDDSNVRLAVQQAQAAVTLAQEQAQSTQAQSRASKAQADASRQEQANAALDNQRNQMLGDKGLVPREDADNARFKLKEAQAAFAAANATIDSVQASSAQASTQILTARLKLAQAQLDLSHTVITAPADGVLGEVSIQPGDFVSIGEDLFPMVDSSSVWVAANFKETDLERIHPGQPVSVELDMYPKQRYQGEVESVSPASGSSFSLIPAQNATGNWVKVTQRFPVHIRILNPDGNLPLRLGASASATIDATSPPPAKD